MDRRSSIDSAIAVLSDAKNLLETEPRIRGAHRQHLVDNASKGTTKEPENPDDDVEDDEILFNYEAILRMNDDIINKAQENADSIFQLSRSYKVYSDMKSKAKDIESKIDILDDIHGADLHEKYGLRLINICDTLFPLYYVSYLLRIYLILGALI
jgi:hypothetical protein